MCTSFAKNKTVHFEIMWSKQQFQLRSAVGVIFTLSILAISTQPTNGANILGIFTSHSPSHLIIHMSIVKNLAERGHNVTVVTSMEPKVTHKDITVIVIPPTDAEKATYDKAVIEMAASKNSIFSTILRLLTNMSVMIEQQFNAVRHDRFKELYTQKFDLIIQGYFLNEFQLGIAAKFNCPIIVSWMNTPMEAVDQLVGNPRESSYVPTIFVEIKQGKVMNFLERLKNFVLTTIFRGVFVLFDIRAENFYNDLFLNENNFPTLNEMKRNVSLIFTNSHSHSEGPIRPLVPATVEIGGIQIKDKPDPLPKDIAEFIETSEHGAILLSLGSNIKSIHIKPEIVHAIFSTLSNLKQRVIWKWEDLNNTPGSSPNILYKKWVPQDDILAHPKIKLFITHAGKGGITEAQYHGVPMLALPIFGDQLSNAFKMASDGYGVTLELLKLTVPEFRTSILEVVENPKYTDAIKKFSNLYRDRPLSARQNVIFWSEYVLRHNGAKHLQSPAVQMCSIAYYNIDVYCLLLVIAAIFVLITKLVLKLICRKIFQRKSNKSKKTNKLKKN